MKGVVAFVTLIALALVTCGIGGSVVSRSAERVAIYGIDAAASYATNPQSQLDRSLEFQQTLGPTRQQPVIWPFVLGLLVSISGYLIFTQQERAAAAAKLLKEKRLLNRQNKRPERRSSEPLVPQPIPSLRQLPVPDSFPDEQQAQPQPGDTW